MNQHLSHVLFFNTHEHYEQGAQGYNLLHCFHARLPCAAVINTGDDRTIESSKCAACRQMIYYHFCRCVCFFLSTHLQTRPSQL